MGYHTFKQTVAVFGFGRFDRKRQHIYGRQGVMIQVALQLNKHVYVYDEVTEQWYQGEITYTQGKDGRIQERNRFEPCDIPDDFLDFPCIFTIIQNRQNKLSK